MSLYHVTDWHFRLKNPHYRKGDYLCSLSEKLCGFADDLEEEDVVVCTGDLFDHPVVSSETLRTVVAALSRCRADWYFVIGQHDVLGHSVDAWHKCSVGVVLALPNCHLLTDEPRRIDHLNVSLRGYHWGEADTKGWQSANWFESDNVLRVVAIHESITAAEQVFGTTLAGTLNVDADLILCGDIHTGLPAGTLTGNQVRILNPGSAGRKSVDDAWRKPKAYRIDVSSTGRPTVNDHYLTDQFGEDVFRLKESAGDKQESSDRAEWVADIQSVSDADELPTDPEKLIDTVCEELGKPPEVATSLKGRVLG